MRRRCFGLFFQIATILFWAGISLSSAQTPPEAYVEVAKQAAAALKARDLDTAIRLYTEAIDIFPKIDAFTPKSKPRLATDRDAEINEYSGLDRLYRERVWAYWDKKDADRAEADANASLIVIQKQIERNAGLAGRLRSGVDLAAEKKNGNPNSYNSMLIKAAFSFGVIKMQCTAVFDIYRMDALIERMSPPRAIMAKQSVADNIVILRDKCRAAQYGEAEAFSTVVVETGNRTYFFTAQKVANELVVAFPSDAESYRVRARVNRYLGNERQALADEQKVTEMSGKK